MKTNVLAVLLCLFFFSATAQENAKTKNKASSSSGDFSFGIRSTQSLFGSTGYPGMGFGGQFRIRLNDKLSTEWFADHIKTDLGGLGHRETAHIGWSVMFYPFNGKSQKGTLLPYVLAGHCFDYAQINGYQHVGASTVSTNFETKRWTSAVQLGIGTSYHLTDRFDASFSAQYMSHLGDDLHTEEEEESVEDAIGEHLHNDTDHGQLAMEGHLLLTFSLNYILKTKSKS